MIPITKNDFISRTGVDLTNDVREDGLTPDRQAEALLLRWEKYVYQVASEMGFPIQDASLNDKQKDAIIDAVCNYGLFCIMNGDYQVHQPKDKNPTPDIIQKLKQFGIIKNGFKGRSCGGGWFR